MDQQQQQIVNQAAREWTEAVRQSFQTLADQTVSLQESNLRLTQNFFQRFVEQLQSGQALRQQGQLQQQAFDRLAEESANAYSDFLNSALSFYQRTMSQAAQAAQGNLRTSDQVARRNVQVAEQVAQLTTRAAAQTAENVALVAGHAPQRVFASSADREAGRPVPIGGPDAGTDEEHTSSEYTLPDHAAALRLVDELLSGESGYDEETWPEIAEALDRDRPSHRKLFVG